MNTSSYVRYNDSLGIDQLPVFTYPRNTNIPGIPLPQSFGMYNNENVDVMPPGLSSILSESSIHNLNSDFDPSNAYTVCTHVVLKKQMCLVFSLTPFFFCL